MTVRPVTVRPRTAAQVHPAAAPDPEEAPENGEEGSTIQMHNFPVGWVTDAVKLPIKISTLLEKFGKLQEAPTINSTSRGIVATATFLSRSDALKAVNKLHGVDNRTEVQKTATGRKVPNEDEKFHVQMAPAAGDGAPAAEDGPPAGPPQPSARPPQPSAPSAPAGRAGWTRNPPSEERCRLQLSCLPLEWTAQDIQELCSQYGPVDSVFSGGPGDFVVTFGSPDTAAAASNSLSGLQMQTETGYNTLQCELLSQDNGAAAGEGEAEAAAEEPAEEAQQDDPMPGALNEGGSPLSFYVDELQLATGNPGPDDHEIFLRDLPLEDYTEQQLREWLDDFGAVTDVIFIRDNETKDLTGRGYVRFATHEEAEGLINAFPQVSEDDGNVKGSWSLSERMLQGAGGPFKADIVSMMAERIRPLQENLRCAALVFAGDTIEGGPELQALGLDAGPLHFVCSRQHRLGTPDKLQTFLAEALSEELSNPGAAAAAAVAKAAGGHGGRQPAGGGAEAASRQDSAKAPAAAQEQSPCILVRGFPDSWKEQQVRLVFAVFGGVTAVRIEQEARGRVARVQLKIADNMPKAVDQLDGTQVGDGELIEECTISCRLLGMSGSAGGVAMRSIFVDELSMTSRPDLPPGEKDREVFLQSLPVSDCTEDQIRAWLSGFGQVEDVFLLQDQAGTPTGKGYVRFVNHAEAAACVEAQASVADAEEGDVVAHWSESERALQHLTSVYGVDVLAALAPRTLDGIKRAAKIRSLWMCSEEKTPQDPAAPAPEAKQLHFIAECTEEQFADLRSRLSRALEDFHKQLSEKPAGGKEEASTRRSSGEKTSSKADRGSRSCEKRRSRSKRKDGSKAEWAAPLGHHYRGPEADWGPPPGQHWRGPEGHPPWQPPGYGPPPGHPDPWQAYGGWRGPMPPRGPAPYGGYPPGPPPGKGDWKGGPPPGPWPYPPGWPGAPPGGPGGYPPDRPPGSFEPRPPNSDGRDRSRSKEKAGLAQDGKRAKTEDTTHAKTIERGEALVKEAKQLSDKGGNQKKAYERYCRGLQVLLDVMPKLPEDDANAAELRVRVNGYLEEAERLKSRIESEPRPSGGGDRGSSAQGHSDRGERDSAREGEKGPRPPPPERLPERSPRGSPSSSTGGLSSSARPRPEDDGIAKGGASKARGSAPAQREATSDPKGLMLRLKRGEDLINEARAAEERNLLEEAYEKYCRGLQYVLEVMPRLPENDPAVQPLRQKVSSYLERAEHLKDKLEPGGRGGDRRSSGQDSSKRSGGACAGERHVSGRSRSRHRHKHRSRSRSRRHGSHGAHHQSSRHRTRSRSRGGGGSSRKDPLPQPHSGSSHGRGGLLAAPQPPPVRSGPPKAPGVPDAPVAEATRAKAAGIARPPPGAGAAGAAAATPLLRPKSGSALLVGKAKASVKR